MEREMRQSLGNGRASIACPICGKRLSDQLPCIESVVTEQLYFSEYVRIVNSIVTIRYIFSHDRDEENENSPLEISHPLVAVIRLVFNNSGECTEFDILDVLPQTEEWQGNGSMGNLSAISNLSK